MVLMLNVLVEKRVEQVMEMLKPHKKKVKKLINPVTNEIMHPLNLKRDKMDIEIKGLSMKHKTTQSDWQTVASCLASQNYISIVKV